MWIARNCADGAAGRQWAFNLTCLISAAFGLGLGGCNTYDAFLVVTAFVGFGVGGNIPIDTTICLEFIPQSKRFLLALLSIFQPIGVVICSAIAYGFIPKYSCEPNFSFGKSALPSCNAVSPGERCCTKASNMGWRYTLFTLGAITLFIFFLRFVVFRFQESPKYLVYRGRDDKAVAVLEHIAKFNKRPCGVSLQDFEALTSEDDSQVSGMDLIGAGDKQRHLSVLEKVKIEFIRYGMLFDGFQMTRLTLLVWVTYICDFWGFTLAGRSRASPKDLIRINADRHLSSHHPCNQERFDLRHSRADLQELHGDLYARHCWCSTRCYDVPRATPRSPIDNDHFRCLDGRQHLRLLGSQHTSIQHRTQHDGVVSDRPLVWEP